MQYALWYGQVMLNQKSQGMRDHIGLKSLLKDRVQRFRLLMVSHTLSDVFSNALDFGFRIKLFEFA